MNPGHRSSCGSSYSPVLGPRLLASRRIQRSRVTAISGLVTDRSTLLTELMTISATEQSALAENLHDGALQYILAARMDLDDLRAVTGAEAEPALDRLDEALTQSARLLRDTVTELHPAVLDQAGIPAAVQHSGPYGGGPGGCHLIVDATAWPAGARTAHDRLLFSTARELVTNVVKHAQARTLSIRLALTADRIEMTVHDDGVGTDVAGPGRPGQDRDTSACTPYGSRSRRSAAGSISLHPATAGPL